MNKQNRNTNSAYERQKSSSRGRVSMINERYVVSCIYVLHIQKSLDVMTKRSVSNGPRWGCHEVTCPPTSVSSVSKLSPFDVICPPPFPKLAQKI